MSGTFQFYEDPWPFKTIEEKRGAWVADSIAGISLWSELFGCGDWADEPRYTITDKGREMLGGEK